MAQAAVQQRGQALLRRPPMGTSEPLLGSEDRESWARCRTRCVFQPGYKAGAADVAVSRTDSTKSPPIREGQIYPVYPALVASSSPM